jgi:hypothetical protein
MMYGYTGGIHHAQPILSFDTIELGSPVPSYGTRI